MLYRWLLFVGMVLVPIDAAVLPLLPSLLKRLHEAIDQGNIESIQSLIALSANPNAQYLNRTSLEAAVVYKNPVVIQCLINNGALLSDNIIELLLRSGNERYSIAQVIASLYILLDAGALKCDLSAIPQGYLTPVMLAHHNSDAIHKRIITLIQNYGKQKLA